MMVVDIDDILHFGCKVSRFFEYCQSKRKKNCHKAAFDMKLRKILNPTPLIEG